MGDVTFNGLALISVPDRVMTPRPASEQLVDAALACVGSRAARVADVGTGSGAIAVAIANVCPRAEVWATDVTRAAVALARANVHRHGLEGRVFVRRGDLLAPVAGSFDLIVANLPYIPAASAACHPELHVEPFDAVFTPGDGLDPYRRLIQTAWMRLTPDGVLLFQLYRRIVRASHFELPALRVALDTFARRLPSSPIASAGSRAAA